MTVLSPNEQVALLCRALENAEAKRWLSAWVAEHHPECFDPVLGNRRMEALLAKLFCDVNADISRLTFAQVRARLELVESNPQWSRERPPAEWRRLLDCSLSTLNRRIDNGEIRAIRVTRRRVKIDLRDLPETYDDAKLRY